MGQLTFRLEPEKRIFTVAELTSSIRRTLGREYDDIRVAGEISGLTIARSGHAYFTLKDKTAVLGCVLFASALRLLRFKPQEGLAVVARGSIDVYEPRGQYQFIVQGLEPQGFGALQLAFEQLKNRLTAEGLFAPERKRPLPKMPRRIGIVTSPSGAAIRDIIHVLTRRFPGVCIRLFPTAVQGEGAVEGICNGLEYFSRTGWAEVVIAGRGGGSLEDLWAFNEEAVARAIAACQVPVVSAVGHETDFTIADFVADLRAPTPSVAAELVVPNRADMLQTLSTTTARAGRAARYLLAYAREQLMRQGVDKAIAVLHRRIGRGLQAVDEQDYRLRNRLHAMLEARRRALDSLDRRLRERDLRVRLARDHQRLDAAARAAAEHVQSRLRIVRSRLEPQRARLEALSPLRVLERGYAVVQTADGQIVKRPSDAPAGVQVQVRLSEGWIGARVEQSPLILPQE